MQIVFIISSLSSGGAERVVSIMANYWAKKEKQVTIVTIDSKESDFYFLHPKVKRVGIALMKPSASRWEAFWNNFYRVKRLREEINVLDPDVVISFIDKTNVLTLLATLGLNKPVVVSERTDPAEHDIGWFWLLMRRFFYKRASAVVVQSEGVHRWAQTFLRRDLLHKIPNPVEKELSSKKESTFVLPEGRSVVSMGRLTAEKGFDILLRAFAICAPQHPEWQLVIFGEGEERDRLVTLAKRLEITNRVLMPGEIKDPKTILPEADLFVLPSRYEGFPNALLEAMACGLPVVSFDCPSGPGQIIRDGQDGILVPAEDVASLAAVMDRLMSNHNERKQLGSRAKEVTERFSLEKVMGMWEDLLEKIL